MSRDLHVVAPGEKATESPVRTTPRPSASTLVAELLAQGRRDFATRPEGEALWQLAGE
jgi:hypothetical protein